MNDIPKLFHILSFFYLTKPPVSLDIGNCAPSLGTNGHEPANNCIPNMLYYKDL